MRGALATTLALALAALALAGCSDSASPDSGLRAFSAEYRDQDGAVIVVELGQPRPLFGPDGETRLAYPLSYGIQDSPWGLRTEALGPDLRVVRMSGCFAMTSQDTECRHQSIRFDALWEGAPSYGIAYPRLFDAHGNGDLVRVDDPRVDLEDDPQAHSYYEYKRGELWPQRYVRAAESWDFEEDLLRLVSITPGELLAPIAAWPAQPESAGLAASDSLFPGADALVIPGLPFSAADAVEAIRAEEAGGRQLAGGCIVDLHNFSAPDYPSLMDPLPPLATNQVVGELMLKVVDSDGGGHFWWVYMDRDPLGQETLHATTDGDVEQGHPRCDQRQSPVVQVPDFLAAVPEVIQQGEYQSFSVGWWRSSGDETARVTYSVQYSPSGGGHYRSATMDAASGLWTSLTYLTGDRVDPENNG